MNDECARKGVSLIIHYFSLRFSHQINARDQKDHADNERCGCFSFRDAETQNWLAVGQESDKGEQNDDDAKDGKRCAKEAPEICFILH